MAVVESIEGSAGSFWYHYDLTNDVLYLRRASQRETPTHGEETDDGFILLRSVDDDHVVGMTVVNWWKRFGTGTLPESIPHIAAKIDPWAQRAAAAA